MIRRIWNSMLLWGLTYTPNAGGKYDEDSAIQVAVAGHRLRGSNSISPVAMEDGSIDMSNALRFNVLPARGGVIVELRKYDHKIDRNNNSTHIIPEGENVAESIGQIVSLELLRS